MTAHFPNTSETVTQLIDYTPRRSLYRQGLKRVFDICFALCALTVIAPVVAVLALIIMTDGGNPFFTQRRVGKDGRTFTIVKLRSMVVDADRRLAEHLSSHPHAQSEWDSTQKLTEDPRITVIGRLIRKSSLDELPQFFNVLKGDMSVVGPRPMMLSQRDLYPGQAYYALKPGVTGFWQIGDRHHSSFADRARFDADYYEQMSLRVDLSVIFKTVKVVLEGTGI